MFYVHVLLQEDYTQYESIQTSYELYEHLKEKEREEAQAEQTTTKHQINISNNKNSTTQTNDNVRRKLPQLKQHKQQMTSQ